VSLRPNGRTWVLSNWRISLLTVPSQSTKPCNLDRASIISILLDKSVLMVEFKVLVRKLTISFMKVNLKTISTMAMVVTFTPMVTTT
jgi:hypothetical protein